MKSVLLSFESIGNNIGHYTVILFIAVMIVGLIYVIRKYL